ncbi:serine/threonine-protein kinase [Roseiconus nitratireducens]|uniref:Serine/threonine-protein kinase n=2 Tax=Roseiconus nitratireducens TaxID=2605748 RepID=A0A5M6DBP4_9BACT|nr:serine/threonine-protein kinase [Roseiconus nitratireducens]
MAGTIDETILGSPPDQPRPMSFTFPPGSRPLPPYTIRRGVGIGGFGEVYFAVSDAGKEVALKRIQRNLEIELRGVSQCLNLKHPNLVALYDICRDADGGSWVVMEYVAGESLRDVLDKHPDGLPETQARRWFAGIASGVDHLHSAGLVHRDLKPGNVFDDLGIVKVGDYGLSKFISSSQRGGHTESVGTFHYMAPEIGRGHYGREIDVYALGVMLFELLTGRVPFDGESCHEIIVKHLTSIPDLSDIPSPYRETIAAALEKDPGKRPATVSEMLANLGLASDAVAIATLAGAPASASMSAVGTQSFTSSGNPTSRTPHAAPLHGAPLHGAGVVQGHGGIGTAGVVHAGAASDSGPAMAHGAGSLASPPDEPLLRAVRKSMADLRVWWKSLEQSPRSRFWIGVLVAFVLFVNTHWLLPVLSILGAIYVPYYIIRQMVLHSSEQPSYARAHQIASQSGPPSYPRSRNQWRSEVRHSLRAKHNLVRLAELNTSWIASALTVLAMTVAAGVIGLRSGNISAVELAPYFWIALVILLGAQGILGLGKLWERDEGEGLPRRLVLAGVGAGVGLAAYGLNEFLMLPMQVSDSGLLGRDLPQALYRDDGTIRAAGMMAHFAVLLGAIRWWKPVDPLRRTRLSLWSVAVVCVAAWGIHQFLPMPQPAGILIAGGLAIATQMSAPWINPRLVQTRQPNSKPNVEVHA